MDMSETKELLELAQSIGSSAGDFLMKRPATFELVSKSTAIDIATQMDKGSEELIVSAILKARPSDGIIAEEGSAKESTQISSSSSLVPLNKSTNFQTIKIHIETIKNTQYCLFSFVLYYR